METSARTWWTSIYESVLCVCCSWWDIFQKYGRWRSPMSVCLLSNLCTFRVIFVKVGQGIHDQNISSLSKTSKFVPVDQIFLVTLSVSGICDLLFVECRLAIVDEVNVFGLFLFVAKIKKMVWPINILMLYPDLHICSAWTWNDVKGCRPQKCMYPLAFLERCTDVHFATTDSFWFILLLRLTLLSNCSVIGRCWLEHPSSTNCVNWLALDVRHVNAMSEISR